MIIDYKKGSFEINQNALLPLESFWDQVIQEMEETHDVPESNYPWKATIQWMLREMSLDKKLYNALLQCKTQKWILILNRKESSMSLIPLFLAAAAAQPDMEILVFDPMIAGNHAGANNPVSKDTLLLILNRENEVLASWDKLPLWRDLQKNQLSDKALKEIFVMAQQELTTILKKIQHD